MSALINNKYLCICSEMAQKPFFFLIRGTIILTKQPWWPSRLEMLNAKICKIPFKKSSLKQIKERFHFFVVVVEHKQE